MNCSRFRSELQSLVETRSPLSAVNDELREHLSSCRNRECRTAWYELCLLDQAIGEWVADFPDLDSGGRVITELRSPSATTVTAERSGATGTSTTLSRRHNRSRWIVVSVAMLVLVSVIAILNSVNEPGTVAEHEQAPNIEPLSPAPPAPPSPFASPDRELAEADLSRTYLAIAEDATHFLTDTVALTLAGEEEIDDPTAAADWIHQVQDRVGPWGEGFDAALDRFLGTIPDSES